MCNQTWDYTRNGSWTHRCHLCDQGRETMDHIMAECPFTRRSGSSSSKPCNAHYRNQQQLQLYGGGAGCVLSTTVINVKVSTLCSRWFVGWSGKSVTHGASETLPHPWPRYYSWWRLRQIAKLKPAQGGLEALARLWDGRTSNDIMLYTSII